MARGGANVLGLSGGGGVQTLDAQLPIGLDDTDPENPVIFLDIDGATELADPSYEDLALVSQAEEPYQVTLSQLGTLFTGADRYVVFTDDAANDLIAWNAAIAAVGAGAGNIKTIKAFGTLRLGATLPTDSDYIRWDFTSITAIKKDGTWTTGGPGWIQGIGCSVIGAGKTPIQWISGTGGPVFGPNLVTVTGFDFDATWDSAAANMTCVGITGTVIGRIVSLTCSGVASTSNRCNINVSGSVGGHTFLGGNWFNAVINTTRGHSWLSAAYGTLTHSGNHGFLNGRWVTGNITTSGEGIEVSLGVVAGTLTNSATASFIQVQYGNGLAVVNSGINTDIITAQASSITSTGGNGYIRCTRLSGALTLTSKLRGNVDVQIVASGTNTHFLGTGTQCRIGITSTAAQTFSTGDGGIHCITGSTDGPDVVIASTAVDSDWDINLTGSGGQLSLSSGATDNNIRFHGDVAPVFNGTTTYNNSVQWFDRAASGAGRWVSVRRPNRILQTISQAYIASLGAVTEYDVPITETLPAGAQVIGQRIHNLGDDAEGVTDMTAQGGIAGDEDGFIQEASVLAANACADVRGALVCGSYSAASSVVCKLKTTGGNLGDVTGLANGLLFALDYIA